MNGIDVASYQSGIDFSKVPVDFVIIKITQGLNYINPAYKNQLASALNNKKLTGVYHYITGDGASAEAKHFCNNIKDRIGKSIICLDWEQGSNKAWNNTAYLRKIVQKVISLTNIIPVIYVQQSAMQSVKKVVPNCPLWIAQYANMNITGYQIKPWNEGKYDCVIRQYSSKGRLTGWAGNLDLNKFYGTKNDWMKLVNNTATTRLQQGQYKIGNYVVSDVEYGDRGDHVKLLQTLLNKNGFNCGVADGVCGDKTLKALASFQASKRRTTCGKGTWKVLLK